MGNARWPVFSNGVSFNMAKAGNTFFRLLAVLLIYSLALPLFAVPEQQKAGGSLTEEQKIIHVLNRLGYGPRPGDVEKVKSIGLKKYIEQQLSPETIDDSVAERKVGNLEIFQMSTAEVFAKYPNPGALLQALNGGRRQQPNAQPPLVPADPAAAQKMTEDEQRLRRQQLQELYQKYDLRPAQQILPQIVTNRFVRAVYSERQLQEVMVDFWQNHFNVFAGKAAVRWYIPSYERDVLRKYALGNFRDLLLATAQHPAMLFYLDNFESVAPNAQNNQANNRLRQLLETGRLTPAMREQIKARQGISDAELDRRIEQMRQASQQRRGLNENYARELMELHTLGVEGGYTQKDIIEVARAFTGWTIADPRGYRRAAAEMIRGDDNRRLERLQRQAGIPENLDSGQFYFNPRWHDNGPKYVLGQKIDEGGIKDGIKVIDILSRHPSTAKFIARKLCEKFVSDNPSEALVGRVADAFSRSGGDIRATLRAIFEDPEFFAPENYRAKIKTPFELAVSAVRALGGETSGGPAILAMLNKLGEVPYGYQAPTGYPDKAEDWVNTGALLERLNFAVAIASNRIPGTRVNLSGFSSADRKQLLDTAIKTILHNEISPATRAALEKQMEKPLPDLSSIAEPADGLEDTTNLRAGGGQGGRMNRQIRLLQPSGDPEVFKAISLVLGAPEFQRQ